MIKFSKLLLTLATLLFMQQTVLANFPARQCQPPATHRSAVSLLLTLTHPNRLKDNECKDGTHCSLDQECCGNGDGSYACAPAGVVCCNNGFYCPSSYTCQAGGACGKPQ